MGENFDFKAKHAQIQRFKEDIRNLISLERLKTYDNDIAKHNASLEFNARLTPKIAQAEIYLRNIVDFCMQLVTGSPAWIINAPT
ncbi:hypothetical protein NHP21005_09920 [Helicobacter sp. NHP21005]|uniref:CAAX protease n=1 Tax=Helicobacter felistomachi TaxID=3040201 RepID=UPI002572EBE3|nr:CAAX protease [Helicobacter sp. NHP21005]BEG57304.1 hypothetical protein NHP21005_09920 [Helicobacter sp. NHP21005]